MGAERRECVPTEDRRNEGDRKMGAERRECVPTEDRRNEGKTGARPKARGD